MKAIAFTLDALFALIIAMAAMAFLFSFQFSTVNSYLVQSSQSASLLNTFSATNIAEMGNSSTMAEIVNNQASAQNQTWPQFMKDNAHNSGNANGPLYPSIAYIFTAASSITSPIVADYGNLYFAATGVFYALNATYGTIAWSTSASSSLTYSPALADGKLIIVNSYNYIDALNPLNGANIWSTALTGAPTTAITIYDGKAIVGTSNNYIYAYYINNGTLAWSAATGYAPYSIAVMQGTILVTTSSTTQLRAYTQNGNSAFSLWCVPNSCSGSYSNPTYATVAANVVAYSANAFSNDGSLAINVLPGATMYGTGSYKNNIYFQAASSVVGVSNSGSTLWGVPTFPTSMIGVPLSNSYPVASNDRIYSLWTASNGNFLVGQNASSGSVEWYTHLPTAYPVSPYMALAYGKLYVVAGDKLIAFGSCALGQNTAIKEAASLYSIGKGGCADALANSVYPLFNYSIVLNGQVASGAHVANFDGSTSYAYIGANSIINTNSYTWSFWIYPKSWAAGNAGVIAEGNYGYGYPYMIEQYNATAPQRLQFSVRGGFSGYTTYAKINLKQWQHVVGTYNFINGQISLYVNGRLVSQTQTTPTTRPLSAIYLGSFPSSANYFDGMIANFQIYNQVLGTSQILQLYQEGIQGAPIPNAGNVAWYPLDGDTSDYGSFLNPAYPVNLNYAFSNFTNTYLQNSQQVSKSTTAISLKVPSVLSISGLSAAYVPSNPQLTLTDSLTLSLWLRTDKAPVGYASHPINKWDAGINNANYVLYVFGTTSGSPDSIGFYGNTITNAWTSLTPWFKVQNNKMYNIVFTYNSTDGGALFIDGNEIGTVTTSSGQLRTSSAQLNLGDTGFYGAMSNLQFYNSVLTNAQIKQIYTQGLQGRPVATASLTAWYPLNSNGDDGSIYSNDAVLYSGHGSGSQSTVSLKNVGVISWR